MPMIIFYFLLFDIWQVWVSEEQPFKFDIWMRAHTNDRTDRAYNQDTAESFINFLSQKKKYVEEKRHNA